MTGTDLTLRPFFWRATRLFPEVEVVSRGADGETFRYTYADVDERVRALAAGLESLGVGQGDRVGTFAWNHHRHYEAYFGVPMMGAQIHTINVQLPDEHVEYIVNDAADDVLCVDPSMVETVERLWDRFDSVREVVVMGGAEDVPDSSLDLHAYEDLVADHRADGYEWPDVGEDQPAGMCYTSGTTGPPKGVEYTHKMYYAHSMMVTTPPALDLSESAVTMAVVPMFHVNGWEFPYAATMVGAKQVYPGPSPDAADLVSLIESEGVTLTAGVPTVWINVLDYLEDHDADLSSLERIVVGGSAAPAEMMRRYEDDYGVSVDHAWGMTETMSIGSMARPKASMADWDREDRYAKRKTQGLLSPGLEMRIVDDDGNDLPWDGESVGELLVRGPTVVTEYYGRPDAQDEDFDGDWLRTGDIGVVDEDGYIQLVDRAKDVIKSGGEWISSIELENALMAHDDVVEAAVVAVPHDRWGERPYACVVRREGSDVSADDLRAFLEEDGDYPSWWLPDDVMFVEEVPKTATGKFDKKSLREDVEDPELRWTPGER